MSGLLAAIGRFERWGSILAFAVMTLALIADVASRRLFQTGLVGATEVAVFGMIAVAMFGIGVATDHGAHFRARLFDALVPARLEPAVDRVASAVTSGFFLIFGALAAFMVVQSALLGDRTEILRAPVWILQVIILFAFAANAARYAVYALDPALKPGDDPVEAASAVDPDELADGGGGGGERR